MKISVCRPVMVFVIAFILILSLTQTGRANTAVPGHVSGYNNHMNSQNNWGLFGIIGVIALAGLTKRNVVQKN